ncbi:glycoside hydrolase family 2 [Natronosalvus rutilus]|uniref:Glycoside hydrolase family 2 n=1 Tax=Natronosalvus rutilus TaxID=2953753 RepID=A0A9E7N9U8_9EURY|nr:glycoside hydrolase family 2 [Natronosalvus rutilus]UTF53496.1 glycoside hydrolase family 2 [Natronosalvus rutilus]
MAGKWMAGVVESRSDDGPPTVDRWTPVSVPGRPGGFAEAARSADERLAYRTTIADPRTTPDDRTLLALHGASGLESIRIDGIDREIDPGAPYFVPTRLEFEPESETELHLEFATARTAGGVYNTDEVPPELGLPGIWWGAAVQVRPQTFIDELSVTPRLEGETAHIDVELVVDVGEKPLDDSITLSLRPEGFRGGGTMDRVRVDGDPGERVAVSKTLEVRDPSLWWPRGYGDQHRYTVRAKLDEDATERTVGLRTVERTDDELLVNDRPIRARGVARLPGGDPLEDVQRAVDCNANLVRARGHVPRPEFYDACDEAGVLVWQDLPITGADPEFEVDRATELAEVLLEHYGSHPSLGLVGVRNEPIDPFADPLGSGWRARPAFRWRAWRAGVDERGAFEVADSIPDSVATVPLTGAPGLDATATTLYPGWRYLEATDVEWLLDRYPSLGRFVGAFGSASLTDDVDPAAVTGVDATLLERRAASPEDSLAEQSRTMRTVAEALRRHESSLLVASSLRDSAPGGGTGVLTVDGEPKPAFEALASAYEPVQAVLDAVPVGGGEAGVTVVNDGPELLETTVSWRAGERSGETSVTVNATGCASAGTVDVSPDADAVVLLLELPNRTVENRYGL